MTQFSKITQQVLSKAVTKVEALEILDELRSQAMKDRYDGKKDEEGDNEDLSYEYDRAKEEIVKMPVLTIIMPVELPLKFVRQVGFQARKLISEDMFIEMREDKSLVSGCSLVWGGKLRDYSIKDTLEAKKEEIEREISAWVKNISYDKN